MFLGPFNSFIQCRYVRNHIGKEQHTTNHIYKIRFIIKIVEWEILNASWILFSLLSPDSCDHTKLNWMCMIIDNREGKKYWTQFNQYFTKEDSKVIIKHIEDPSIN